MNKKCVFLFLCICATHGLWGMNLEIQNNRKDLLEHLYASNSYQLYHIRYCYYKSGMRTLIAHRKNCIHFDTQLRTDIQDVIEKSKIPRCSIIHNGRGYAYKSGIWIQTDDDEIKKNAAIIMMYMAPDWSDSEIRYNARIVDELFALRKSILFYIPGRATYNALSMAIEQQSESRKRKESGTCCMQQIFALLLT